MWTLAGQKKQFNSLLSLILAAGSQLPAPPTLHDVAAPCYRLQSWLYNWRRWDFKKRSPHTACGFLLTKTWFSIFCHRAYVPLNIINFLFFTVSNQKLTNLSLTKNPVLQQSALEDRCYQIPEMWLCPQLGFSLFMSSKLIFPHVSGHLVCFYFLVYGCMYSKWLSWHAV